MQSNANANGRVHPSAKSTVIRRHFWIRHERAIWPFFWRGLLPALGLVLLLAYAAWPFARHDIEQAVRSETRAVLDRQGMRWVDVSVSGQDVILSGTPPNAGAGDRALDIARAAACATWAGPLTCAVRVTGRFAEPVAVSEAPKLTPAPVPTPLPSATPAEPSSNELPRPTPLEARTLSPAAMACEQKLAAITAKSVIEFETASATIRETSRAVLDALADTVRDCPGVIRVEGHTDARGNSQENRNLSLARADSARRALVERGVPANRMDAAGFGSDRPLGDNSTAEGRAINRRIEFKVISEK